MAPLCVMYTRFTNPEVIAADQGELSADAAKECATRVYSHLTRAFGEQPPPRTRVKYAYDSNGLDPI